MRRVLATLALVTGLAAVVPGAALALDECRGLKECVPIVGPWVLVPTPAAGDLVAVDWELRCPLRGYVVGGVDSRVTDRGIDVSVRGESGSPVAPGVTTKQALLFTARAASAAAGARPLAFKPAIGCIPLEGGGGRAQTSTGGRAAVVKPGAPFLRKVVTVRLAPGRTRVVAAACPAGRRVVSSGHAVAVRATAPPSAAVAAAVSSSERVGPRSVTVTASLRAGSAARGPVLLQVQAVCARGA
ncbi:MAG: hypothetical protein ACRC50_13765 [Gaiella sp.]